ncbi:MAG: hypothetical protein JXR94_23115 [Candidatus Hydrogenedentes bacterium]|nr:hypothetical protein [Candidatus Hydrogenedentota bacterium]
MERMLARVLKWRGTAALALAVTAMWAPAPPAAAAASDNSVPSPTELPWNLRDRYTFRNDLAELLYLVDNGEWRLTATGPGTVVDCARAAVTLGDGSVVEATGGERGVPFRERVSGPLGPGTEYGVTLSGRGPFTVRHSITALDEHPFYLVRLCVTNAADSAVDVARISPMVIGPGGLLGYGADAEVGFRRAGVRAGCAMYRRDAMATQALFRNPAGGLLLGLGVSQGEGAASGLELRAYGGAWQGEGASVFEPPRRLEPGQQLEGDPVLLSFSVQDPVALDEYSAWACIARPHPEPAADAPDCWVTVPDHEPADALAAATRAWWDVGVRHALVPGTWEAQPGSLEGAAPYYPRDMEKLATVIARTDMVPGIALNPLAVVEGGDDWTAVGHDGQRWLNPATPEGRRFAIEQMRKVVAWGYKFFVVYDSPVPDEVLRHFAMTRAQADALALALVAEAVGDLPVYPATSGLLPAEQDAWLDAAAGMTRLRRYGMVCGPVRFDATNLAALDDAVVAAMCLYGGPIEFVGLPAPDVARQLAPVLPRTHVAAWPLDPAARAPRVWRMDLGDAGAGVVAFPGAGAWRLDQLGAGAGQPAPAGPQHVWRHEGSVVSEVTDRPVPASGRLSVCVVTPALTRPYVAGTSSGPGCVAREFQNVTWNEEKGILQGQFAPGSGLATIAYVKVPEPWEFRSGRVGTASLRPKTEGGLLELRIKAGNAEPFELRFARP